MLVVMLVQQLALKLGMEVQHRSMGNPCMDNNLDVIKDELDDRVQSQALNVYEYGRYFYRKIIQSFNESFAFHLYPIFQQPPTNSILLTFCTSNKFILQHFHPSKIWNWNLGKKGELVILPLVWTGTPFDWAGIFSIAPLVGEHIFLQFLWNHSCVQYSFG